MPGHQPSVDGQTLTYKLRPVKPAPPRFPDDRDSGTLFLPSFLVVSFRNQTHATSAVWGNFVLQ